ncbi:hypothetical protein GALMADRAFT_145916 [Galerina marginata CBS 339.88]|uniref:Uncharacterized protein n=1 Tax=Galerina marginata (strain CBS 339.88) TaxID=685588 RepID=A0A067SFX4_GALM3|nr:hypothetical protein GALMADRAFT_145916 [Galerina marginata CBS 339.88]
MTHTAPSVSGMTVTFILNNNTVMSICGVAISSNPQEVVVTVYKDGAKVEGVDTVKFDEDLEGTNAIMRFVPSADYVDIYGPFAEERKIVLEFGHSGDRNADDARCYSNLRKSALTSGNICATLAQVCASTQAATQIFQCPDGTTRVDMIPYDNGYTENKEVTDCLVTVVRWSR